MPRPRNDSELWLKKINHTGQIIGVAQSYSTFGYRYLVQQGYATVGGNEIPKMWALKNANRRHAEIDSHYERFEWG